MATEGNAENDKTPLLIAEFHPSASFPNFQAMFSELKHGSSLIRWLYKENFIDSTSCPVQELN